MKRSSGLTVIEVLIALVVSGIVISGLFAGINFAGKYARHNANKTMALNFAQAKMEELRNLTYGGLTIGETTDTVDLYQTGEETEEVNIEADRKVVIGEVTVEGVPYKTVKVSVSWDWLGKNYTEEVNTMRSDY